MSEPQDESVLLCTAGYDRIIRFWEAPTAICNKELSMGETQINCLEISPDKTLIAAGGNPVTKIFNTQSRSKEPTQTLEGHTNNIISTGFQKNQKWLFTASEDGTLKIWDLRTSACQRNISVHSNKKIMLSCAILHPNQGEIIAGDQSGTISVWDLQENKIREKWKPEGKSIPIRSLSIAMDASVLCVATHRGTCYAYKPSDEYDEKESVDEKNSSTKHSTTKLSINSSNPSNKNSIDSTLEQSTNGMFTLSHKWSAHSDAYILCCLLSPNCTYVATSSSDSSIKLFNIDKNYKLEKVLKGHTKWVWDLAFSADSAFLISGSSDKTAKLWDLKTGQAIVEYSNHNKAVTCVALNDSS